jgi:hypothetical protein
LDVVVVVVCDDDDNNGDCDGDGFTIKTLMDVFICVTAHDVVQLNLFYLFVYIFLMLFPTPQLPKLHYIIKMANG